jgi:hypothetical protein
VTLRNLSGTGALIEARPTPEVGTRATFKRGTLNAPATVVWSRPPHAGIHFDTAISEAEVLIHIRKSPPGGG